MADVTDTFPITKISKSRIGEVDFTKLEFGKHIADHMVLAEYKNGAWGTAEIIPYGELKMSPATLALHYGQAVFEGMKAFRNKDGNISVFRIQKHYERFTKSLERMCMPIVPEEMFINGLKSLIEVDQAWVSDVEGASLYIRPHAFASESKLGLKISEQYKFVIMTGPVGPYFNKPFRVKVEDEFVRTAEGGTGFTKCAGNYGGAFYPTMLARQQGYDQVLWTDHKEHKYIDEAGMMNVLFVMNGKIVTPALNTALLAGVTRGSILTLAKDMGYEVEERKVSVDEMEEGLKEKTLTEAFGVGTAAVVAPITEFGIHGMDYSLPVPDVNSFQQKVKKKLIAIRRGHEPDVHGWNDIITLS
ncbi:MAG: branched-chain amino acid aminotransferase [Flammeovirgaceae bacterium]|nr:branched-chain amino acid aminotransferase [Flammeovirgaceae bacterium]